MRRSAWISRGFQRNSGPRDPGSVDLQTLVVPVPAKVWLFRFGPHGVVQPFVGKYYSVPTYLNELDRADFGGITWAGVVYEIRSGRRD
jgi:hypothetical protein